MSKISRKIFLNQNDLDFVEKLAKANGNSLLHIPEFRRFLAIKRLKEHTGDVDVYNDQNKGTTPGTVAHNMTELTTRGFASMQRTTRLLAPLSALSPIYEAANKLKVLTIGPRTEMEILHLISIGFLPENIHGLDLLSYSDYIHTGDMHSIPFSDKEFDVVISSWTIGYSSNPQLVIDEMYRVIKSNGLMALGFTHDYKRESYVVQSLEHDHIAGCGFQTALEVLEFFKNKKHRIHFVQEPKDSKANKLMLILRMM